MERSCASEVRWYTTSPFLRHAVEIRPPSNRSQRKQSEKLWREAATWSWTKVESTWRGGRGIAGRGCRPPECPHQIWTSWAHVLCWATFQTYPYEVNLNKWIKSKNQTAATLDRKFQNYLNSMTWHQNLIHCTDAAILICRVSPHNLAGNSIIRINKILLIINGIVWSKPCILLK